MDKLNYYINNSNKPIFIYGKSGVGKTTLLNKLQMTVKFISIQDGSLLGKINQKDEIVKNIWGCSEFGKEMKLC